jgi:Zn-dependent M28 family amino/carboxypeptidase
MAGCSGADDNLSGVAALLEIARVARSARVDRSLLFACWDEQEKGQLGSAAFARAARARGDRIVAAIVLDGLGYASDEPDSQRIPEDFEQAFPDHALRLLEDDYRGNFLTVVTGKASKAGARALVARGEEVELRVEVLELTIRQQQKLTDHYRSDHASFWAADYPALLATDTGTFRNPHFHCIQGADEPDTLDYAFLGRATQASLGALVDLAELR